MPLSEQFNPKQLEFGHTAFNHLMQRRIYRILLVCSNYDFFMLEEDGRIDERIFNEYATLNISSSPVIVHADSAKKAFEILLKGEISLIILMLNLGDTDPFDLAKQIKLRFHAVPIVVLTHFSREVSQRLQNEDLSAIDYVFSWLGNADLLLAIIKLIEDKMNATNDMLEVGVQCIVLAEDSVRYISQILPVLYKAVIRQSRTMMHEGLNDHQKMLRLRGRPKILLARNFEEAEDIYRKFGTHILGFISDVSFKTGTGKERKQGISLCRMVRKDDPDMPFLLQSSDLSNEIFAKELNTAFIHKQSKTLSADLEQYISLHIGFGDFIFRDPFDNHEVARAGNLYELQQVINTIPDQVLAHHVNRNEISKWLNARALFPIANLFRVLTVNDFKNLNHVKQYIHDAITIYREVEAGGIIASFNEATFDEHTLFSRIGEGSIGGKARGLAFINTVINRHQLNKKYSNAIICISLTVAISTDLFDEFLETNHLLDVCLSDFSDNEILEQFVRVPLPLRLTDALDVFLKSAKKPIAIRSSSKLEDSYYQPFAGIYNTYMVPLSADRNETLRMVSEAIKCVYASTFFKASKAYIQATSNSIDEEKMGVILQEVCGNAYDNRFYPAISGVARSINYYPLKPEKSEDGIAKIAIGLGKYIVDGGQSISFSPPYPKKVLQLSNPDLVLKSTQNFLLALNIDPSAWKPSCDDENNLLRLKISEISKDSALRHVASCYDIENHQIRDTWTEDARKVITFSNVLNHNSFPLAEILQELITLGEQEMNTPIEIEFAVDLDASTGTPKTFYFLQIRPIVEKDQQQLAEFGTIDLADSLIYSELALGNGVFHNLQDIVFVIPEKFDASHSLDIALEIEKINAKFLKKKRNYILAGPGRWGSADPWLGIPVKWHQISEARIIIESTLKGFNVEQSQGTHFFHNLTSFGVGYMTISPDSNGSIDWSNLMSVKPTEETIHLRHIHFPKPLTVMIDGKTSRGCIQKP